MKRALRPRSTTRTSAQIFEIGEEQDTLFITMELLAGETLAERIVRGPMALSQAIPLAVEALTALQVIHEQGLIHRDVKPANIFLTPHGVKILDFGLARPTSLSVWIRRSRRRRRGSRRPAP